MRKISCVISCLNEFKNLRLLIKEIKKFKLEKKFEFFIINNGSNDNSKIIFVNLAKKYKSINFINLKKTWGGVMEF